MLSSAEAKQAYFLTTDDLRSLPHESQSYGFGTGRPTWLFAKQDLLKAALEKHGREGLQKKLTARRKREENKRKREEDAYDKEAAKEDERQVELAADPALAAKVRRLEEKKAALEDRNQQLVGEWDLSIVSPESVEGTKASLVMKEMPPDSWDDSWIDCNDMKSAAYAFGNLQGFMKGSGAGDTIMKFETKWKVMGKRYTGCLSVCVLPSDRPNEDGLMVKGKFNNGVNGCSDMLRVWAFKGYRRRETGK